MKKILLLVLLMWGCSNSIIPEDCAGVPDGNAELDNCEVCDTDKANDCVPDCAGVWGGNAIIDCYVGCTNTQVYVGLWNECFSIAETTDLNFNTNQLKGEVLPEIEKLTNLTELDLSNNQLTSIPESFCNIKSNLINMNFSNNKICGDLPSCLIVDEIGTQECP